MLFRSGAFFRQTCPAALRGAGASASLAEKGTLILAFSQREEELAARKTTVFVLETTAPWEELPLPEGEGLGEGTRFTTFHPGRQASCYLFFTF